MISSTPETQRPRAELGVGTNPRTHVPARETRHVGHTNPRPGTGDASRVGHNTITSEQGGCVLIEHWRSVAGNNGMSMNYYEPRSRHWKQNWVSPKLILEMSGALQGESLVMEGPMQYIGNDETTLLRGTWTPLPDGRVRRRFVESKDGGKTWVEWFDGYYARVTPLDPRPAPEDQFGGGSAASGRHGSY